MKKRMSMKKPATLVLSKEVYNALDEFIGQFPAEKGAMLGRDKDGVIRHCVFDTGADCNAVEYNPDIPTMNKAIKYWESQGIEFVGFVHSHPKGVIRPSKPDEIYSANILSCFKDLEQLWIPIAQTRPTSGEFKLYCYAAIPNKDRNDCFIQEAKLKIDVSSEVESTIIRNPENLTLDQIDNSTNHETLQDYGVLRLGDDKHQKKLLQRKSILDLTQTKMKHTNYFQRQAGHFDMDYLSQVRLVVIGTGGANSFIESCARMGVGEFVLIDPDVISESNIATQSVNPEDIGEFKVDSIAKQLLKINPLATVKSVPDIIENINDENFYNLLFQPMKYNIDSILHQKNLEKVKPRKTVLLVLTDNFHAQARGHRLGLNYGVSTICAQAYKEGVGAEITYTVPDVTEACHRCITASRYKGYLEEDYSNDVTSEGSPIFTAEYLNACLGYITLAVIYHNTDHPSWGNVIKNRGNRNLIILKISPNFEDVLGMDLVATKAKGSNDEEAFSMFTAVSLPQTADSGQSKSRPICPDCAGTGNLLNAINSMSDTTYMKTA